MKLNNESVKIEIEKIKETLKVSFSFYSGYSPKYSLCTSGCASNKA